MIETGHSQQVGLDAQQVRQDTHDREDYTLTTGQTAWTHTAVAGEAVSALGHSTICHCTWHCPPLTTQLSSLYLLQQNPLTSISLCTSEDDHQCLNLPLW